jgi:hypothetical protein
MQDPDETVSAVILLENCRSIARLVSADRDRRNAKSYISAGCCRLCTGVFTVESGYLCIVHCTMYMWLACNASFRFEAKITKAKRSEKFETKISEKKRKKRNEIL